MLHCSALSVLQMHQVAFLGTEYNFIWFCTHCRELHSVAQGKIQWSPPKEQKRVSPSTSYQNWATSRCLWKIVQPLGFICSYGKKIKYMYVKNLDPFVAFSYFQRLVCQLHTVHFPGCTGQTLEYLFHLLQPSFPNHTENIYRPWTSSSSHSRTAANTNIMPCELMDKTVLSM